MTPYGFQNLLQYQEIGRKGGHTLIRLTDDLIYIDTQGRKHVIPAGFESDKASIPRTPEIAASHITQYVSAAYRKSTPIRANRWWEKMKLAATIGNHEFYA